MGAQCSAEGRRLSLDTEDFGNDEASLKALPLPQGNSLEQRKLQPRPQHDDLLPDDSRDADGDAAVATVAALRGGLGGSSSSSSCSTAPFPWLSCRGQRQCDNVEPIPVIPEEDLGLDVDGQRSPFAGIPILQGADGPDWASDWKARAVVSEENELDDFDDGELRWAPAEPEGPDKVDERTWNMMVAAMDQFITPLADNTAPVDPFAMATSSSSLRVSGLAGTVCQNGDDSASTPSTRSTSNVGLGGFASQAATVTDGIGTEMQREAAFAAICAGQPLYTLAEHLRADKDLVMAAIDKEGQYCYDYITSADLKERDRDVVQALVARDGSLLANCSPELKADRQLLRLALRTCAEALTWAPKELQNDKELKSMAANRQKQEDRELKDYRARDCGRVPLAQCF